MPGGSTTHYLRGNAMSRQSRRHIFFDTEAVQHYDNGVVTQTWLCGVARYLDADTRRREPVVFDREYSDPSALWDDVSDFTRRNARTLLWAHNLSYDLRISRALELLPPMGWSLRAIVLDGLACWAKFTWDDRTLVMCDFTSWASVPLSRIASLLNLHQEPLPENQDDLRGMLRRCRQDVEILSEAVTHTLGWLAADDLGNLQITGAGQAWSAFRHRFMTHKVLVHDDERAHQAERKAIWTGRTETYRHGVIEKERTYEYDLPRAYATIAASERLPSVYVGSLKRCSLANLRTWSRTRKLLCDCSVTSPAPIVPTEHDGRILWPVGTFKTTLWDCEILAAVERGAKVRLYRTYVYTAEPCLEKWAKWVLSQLDPDESTATPLQQQILKQWSRSLIGRFALRYRSWTPMGTADSADLYLSRIVGKREEKGAQMMHVGTDLLELGALTSTENELPQITGYITAVCRLRLLDLIETAGWENVYYVDTDSLIVNRAGRTALERRLAGDGAYGLVHKRSIRRLELSGPRQLAIDGERRYSGVPKRARQTGSDTVLGEVWEGLGEALRNGHTGTVLVNERTYRLTGSDRRRKWLPDGRTEPISLDGADTPVGRRRS